jgi:hypothetical protein
MTSMRKVLQIAKRDDSAPLPHPCRALSSAQAEIDLIPDGCKFYGATLRTGSNLVSSAVTEEGRAAAASRVPGGKVQNK